MFKFQNLKNLKNNSLLFLVGFFVLLVNPVTASAATLSLNPAVGTFNRGCTAKIDIILDTTGSETDGTDAVLIYDPTRFTTTLAGIKNGTIYVDYPGNAVDSQGGRLNVSGLASSTAPYKGRGTLGTVTFNVPANAPLGAAQIKIDFDPSNKTKTTDSNVAEKDTIADLLNSVTDGNYTIGTGTCVGGGAGAPIATGSATLSPSPFVSTPTARPSALPVSGFFDQTIMIASGAAVFIIMGIVGLALL